MHKRDTYKPGPATGGRVERDGENWTLVLVRELHHPPERVWEALTEPAHLAEWAPFAADRSLATVGLVNLATVGAPQAMSSIATVTRAEAPRLLEYTWTGKELRWELAPSGDGTRLTLWHNIDRGFIAWGAAGWHICLDVLDHLLAGEPIGRIVGVEAMKFDWERLNASYAEQFGITSPSFPSGSKS